MEIVIFIVILVIGLVVIKLMTDDSYDIASSDKEFDNYRIAVWLGIAMTIIIAFGSVFVTW